MRKRQNAVSFRLLRDVAPAALSQPVRTYREEDARREAQEELLASFEPSERAAPEEMEEIRAEWRGDLRR